MRNKKENLKKKQQKSYIHFSSFSSKFPFYNEYDRKLVFVIFSFSLFWRKGEKKEDFSFCFRLLFLMEEKKRERKSPNHEKWFEEKEVNKCVPLSWLLHTSSHRSMYMSLGISVRNCKASASIPLERLP